MIIFIFPRKKNLVSRTNPFITGLKFQFSSPTGSFSNKNIFRAEKFFFKSIKMICRIFFLVGIVKSSPELVFKLSTEIQKK